MIIEKMSDFFAKRVDSYENQMLNGVEGCREGYEKIAEIIPSNCENLLDLGCGTGLELEYIFKMFPDIHVVGVDCTQAMLDKLNEKFHRKNVNIVCSDYFKVDFGVEKFDCVISFQTMHHFSHDSKVSLYKKVRNSLKNDGCYIECDYVAKDLAEEDFFFNESDKIRKSENIASEVLIHFDTPCCVETQFRLFREAGFRTQEKLWQVGQTAIFRSKK